MLRECLQGTALGPVSYSDSNGDVFLGRDFVQRKDYSEKKAEQIDDEVTQILTEKFNEAANMLTSNRDKLDTIAAALLERETLETSDLELILRGDALPPMRAPADVEPPVDEGTDRSEEREDFPGGKLSDPEPFPS